MHDDNEDALDPADADTLDDHTRARRHRSVTSVDLPSQKGRLRLRPKVPVVEGYEGKAVSRDEIFGQNDARDLQGDDRLQQRLGQDLVDMDEGGAVDGSAFGISGDIEKEYSKLMQSAEREMAVMRQPSSADIAQKEENAKDLKHQIEMWGALVELRIHLEGALTTGHRLPSGMVAGLFDAADQRIVSQSSSVASDVGKLLGSMMSLQEKMMEKHCPSLSTDLGQAVNGVPSLEDKVWEMTDARLQAVLDWALNVADEWKEHTRLDARRSFKMLDQSLRLQMQAVSDAEPEKLRKRCTPPPGKHAVFGKSARAVSENGEPGPGPKAAPAESDAHLGNIFDDRDFYVQLLREVLSSSAGGALSAQNAEERELYAEVQGRRAAKRKARAEVERRASKGRKIRYRPIEKLQNFMTGRPRGSFNSKTLGLEDVEPLSQHACDAMLRSLFAPAKAS